MKIKENVLSIQVPKKRSIRARHIIKISKSKTQILRDEVDQYYDSNGFLSWSPKKKKYIILGTNSPKNGLVLCPKCKTGKLVVVRSRKTKKRFMGCSNYYNGCDASSPLLQKASLKVTKLPCKICSWPIVLFRFTRKQKWTRQCSNIVCRTAKV